MVDGVQEKEFSTKLTETLGPMLPFPCVFQVAQDNICAFEFTRLQHYDAIVQISSSEQAFPMTAFIRVLEQVDNYSPPFIVFHEHDSTLTLLESVTPCCFPWPKMVSSQCWSFVKPLSHALHVDQPSMSNLSALPAERFLPVVNYSERGLQLRGH